MAKQQNIPPCDWEFDVFVAYAPEDAKFVTKIIQNVGPKSQFYLNVCVNEREFLNGDQTLTASLMENTCKRIVMVLSPDFLETPMSEFLADYLNSFEEECGNKKVLGIVYRDCDPPKALEDVSSLTYTRPELREWFWPRLAGALCTDLSWTGKVHKPVRWEDISLPNGQSCSLTRKHILNLGTNGESKK